MSATDSTAAVEAVFRIEFPRVVAALARASGGDLGLAEELAQDALVDALRQWPLGGHAAAAWRLAHRRGKAQGVDRFRRDRVLAAKYAEVGRALDGVAESVEGTGACGVGEVDEFDEFDEFDDEIERRPPPPDLRGLPPGARGAGPGRV